MDGSNLNVNSSANNICKKPRKSVKIDERSVKEQEYRKYNRIWEKAIKKHSSTTLELSDGSPDEEEVCRKPQGKSPPEADQNSPIAMQRMMARMKSFAKRKTPLQKFDEVVTREIMSRRWAEYDMCAGVKTWPSNLDFSCSKVTPSGKGISFDTSMSKTTLANVDRELKNKDLNPSDAENYALMDAIEKLIQAQAFCRFDAAVQAAEAATAAVPPEYAEAVAVACAKDYQSKVTDVVSEQFSGGKGKKPIEVIGYIGITKKSPDED